MSEFSATPETSDMQLAPTLLRCEGSGFRLRLGRFLLSRSLWARSSPRLPSDSGKTQSHCVGLGLLPSLQSIRGGAPKLTLLRA